MIDSFIIDNCKFEIKYKCPLYWKNLKETENPKIKFCKECKKEVFKCSNKQDIKKHIKLNHCIAVEGVPIDEKLLGFDNKYKHSQFYYIEWIKSCDDDFDMFNWKDKTLSKNLINEAKEIINSNLYTEDNLSQICGKLYSNIEHRDHTVGIIAH